MDGSVRSLSCGVDSCRQRCGLVESRNLPTVSYAATEEQQRKKIDLIPLAPILQRSGRIEFSHFIQRDRLTARESTSFLLAELEIH